MPGRAQHAAREVGQAAVRVDERRAGQAYGHRVDREVAADEVALEGVAVRHLGLARGAVVGLGAVGRDLDRVAVLERPDGAERDARRPRASRPSPEQALHVLGPGVGGEVEVVAEPAEQGVAHGATDQGQVVPGRREPAAQLVGHRGDPQQLAHGPALQRPEQRSPRARRGAVVRRGHGPSVRKSRGRRPCGPRTSGGALATLADMPERAKPAPEPPRTPRPRPRLRTVEEISAGGLVVDRRTPGDARRPHRAPRPARPAGLVAAEGPRRGGRDRRGTPPSARSRRRPASSATSSPRSAPSTSGSSPRTAGSTRRSTTSCSRPSAASSATTTSRSSRWPGSRSTSSRPGWPTPTSARWSTRRSGCSARARERGAPRARPEGSAARPRSSVWSASSVCSTLASPEAASGRPAQHRRRLRRPDHRHTLTPTSLGPDGTLVIAGRVVNASDSTLQEVGARLRVGTSPLVARGELATFASAAGPPEVGVVPVASLVDVAPELAPGEAADVRIEVPAAELGLIGGFGVHPLTLEIRVADPTGLRRTAGTARTFVVAAGTGSAPTVRVAWVWPLVGTPGRGVGRDPVGRRRHRPGGRAQARRPAGRAARRRRRPARDLVRRRRPARGRPQRRHRERSARGPPAGPGRRLVAQHPRARAPSTGQRRRRPALRRPGPRRGAARRASSATCAVRGASASRRPAPFSALLSMPPRPGR